MNSWLNVFSKRISVQRKQSFYFLSLKSRAKHGFQRRTFFLNKKRVSRLKRGDQQNNTDGSGDGNNGISDSSDRGGGCEETIFRYTEHDRSDGTYTKILEKKAMEIKNSKNCFQTRLKNARSEEEQGFRYQPLDYTTLHLLSIELNVLLQDSIVEHITQADHKTIVLHLSKREKEYYLYICYDNDNPVISLGLKIKKLFNRFIEDDYAQKLNPVLKYAIISSIYMKKSFVKILCIDFILKRKTEEDIDLEDILSNNTNTSSRKVTLLFDLYHNSCISFVINKVNNEILISPHNYITEKTIDKSFKEGHVYIFPTNDDCKIIPNHYEFFSSFLNLFKARKEQTLISSMLDLYEGISYNLLLKFFNYLNISSDSRFSEIDKGLLLDFFNHTYIKWVRFLNLKEKNGTFVYAPHFDHSLNVYSVLHFTHTRKGHVQGGVTPSDVCIDGSRVNDATSDVCISPSDVSTSNASGIARTCPKETPQGGDKIKETHFQTVIELVYYYYGKSLSVNKFYSMLKFCKEFIKKKIPQYEDMLNQYKHDREICEKAYLLHENINTLSVFNHTISKMNDWIDKKTFDALKLIEHELKFNSLEDNRKKYAKRLEEKKQKEEILQKKIFNVQPNTVKTSHNIYKGSLLIKINETDLSSPFLIIGRNSKQNEKISTQILKFNDLWFHVHEHPGGHVILRNKKINGKIITADLTMADLNIDEEIKYAANMAAYFSKARKLEKTLVCFTFGKYILKDNTLKEGAVEVLKYRLVYGRPSKVASIVKDLNERNKEIEFSKKKIDLCILTNKRRNRFYPVYYILSDKKRCKISKTKNGYINVLTFYLSRKKAKQAYQLCHYVEGRKNKCAQKFRESKNFAETNFFNPKQFKNLFPDEKGNKKGKSTDDNECLELEKVENLEEIAPDLYQRLMDYKKSEGDDGVSLKEEEKGKSNQSGEPPKLGKETDTKDLCVYEGLPLLMIDGKDFQGFADSRKIKIKPQISTPFSNLEYDEFVQSNASKWGNNAKGNTTPKGGNAIKGEHPPERYSQKYTGYEENSERDTQHHTRDALGEEGQKLNDFEREVVHILRKRCDKESPRRRNAKEEKIEKYKKVGKHYYMDTTLGEVLYDRDYPGYIYLNHGQNIKELDEKSEFKSEFPSYINPSNVHLRTGRRREEHKKKDSGIKQKRRWGSSIQKDIKRGNWRYYDDRVKDLLDSVDQEKLEENYYSNNYYQRTHTNTGYGSLEKVQNNYFDVQFIGSAETYPANISVGMNFIWPINFVPLLCKQYTKRLGQPVKSEIFNLGGFDSLQLWFYPDGMNNSIDGYCALKLVMKPGSFLPVKIFFFAFSEYNYVHTNPFYKESADYVTSSLNLCRLLLKTKENLKNIENNKDYVILGPAGNIYIGVGIFDKNYDFEEDFKKFYSVNDKYKKKKVNNNYEYKYDWDEGVHIFDNWLKKQTAITDDKDELLPVYYTHSELYENYKYQYVPEKNPFKFLRKKGDKHSWNRHPF
ncbi:hypothetical protein POVWA2_057790 [Plasmodium ovale wallikeri]|uniref:NFACT RNA-binding domain-containing protein n=2 Tax=Plasmodium ovale TaxID=36330 RepID=A0A1A8ZZB0_PLAOA|nr:hypothetical protein POVWA1_058440 [Plasmodium ovale wallikeri]SBT49183.1 hypothetical protein POVWA2_057790 [Plasmodium ovale wallikeri]